MDEVIINGVKYVPEGANSAIGVAITTHNRNELVAKTYAEIKKHTPNAYIVIIDDASSKPVRIEDANIFRLSQNAGIALSKNKCLELLMNAGCQHLFLFDDDCYPKVDEWYRPYIDSPEPHLSHSWDLIELYRDENIVATHAVGGSMIYYDRKAIEAVGGMRTDFGKWGCEHVNLSDRIFNAGLTSWRYQDIPEAYDGEIFYEYDRYNKSTHKTTATQEQIKYNKEVARKLWCSLIKTDQEYIPYANNNVILTSYITGELDPQRGIRWRDDLDDLSKLTKSIKYGRLVVFHDCFAKPELKTSNGNDVEFIKVAPNKMNVFFRRHLLAWQYLRSHPEIGKAWEVDATDVEQLRNPFASIKKGRLYLGWEPTTVGSSWMIKSHPDSDVQAFIQNNSNRQLLNAGLIGGDRQIMLEFLGAMQRYYCDDAIDMVQNWENKRFGVGDMGALNMIAYGQFASRLESDTQVATIFKHDEDDNGISMWRHK